MPESRADSAARMARSRAAARRRQAVAVLRLAEATAAYAAAQVSDGLGLGPDQARAAAVEAASSLAAAASMLRRLAQVSSAERRKLTRELAGQGMRRTEIAARVGVSENSVYRYLRP